VACWAHAPPKSHETISYDAARVKEIIALIAPLDGIEKVTREVDSRPRPAKNFAK
jgi:hypothetical protein